MIPPSERPAVVEPIAAELEHQHDTRVQTLTNLDHNYMDQAHAYADEGMPWMEAEERALREAEEDFRQARAAFQARAADANVPPLVAAVAKVNELAMIRYAYVNIPHQGLLDEADYKEVEKYPYLFEQYEHPAYGQSEEEQHSVAVQGINERYDYRPSEEQGPVEALLARHGLRPFLDHELGIHLEKLPKEPKEHMLRFLVAGDSRTYRRLCTAMQAGPEPEREKLIESFLALEFGDDFGELVLNVADNPRIPEASRHAVLESLTRIRTGATAVAGFFSSDSETDMQLAAGLETAFTKRATEVLALLRERPEALQGAEKTLGYIAQATDLIATGLGGEFEVAELDTHHGILKGKAGALTINLRPEGHNARIGFTTCVPGLNSGEGRLSIRLDREPDGQLSLDIGSTAREGVNVSPVAALVGSTLAQGEEMLAHLRAQRAIASGVRQQQVTLHGNHVREAFPPTLAANPEDFRGVQNRLLYRLRIPEERPASTAA